MGELAKIRLALFEIFLESLIILNLLFSCIFGCKGLFGVLRHNKQFLEARSRHHCFEKQKMDLKLKPMRNFFA